MLNINDIINITDDERISNLKNKILSMEKLGDDLNKNNFKCITSYNSAIPYLIKNPALIQYKTTVDNYDPKNPKLIKFLINISKDGVLRHCSENTFLNDSAFREFTQVTPITTENLNFSFMHAITSEIAYEELSKTLTPRR